MNALPSFKRGATFAYEIAYTEDGVPVPVQASELSAQVRTPTGQLVATIALTPVAGRPGVFTTAATTDMWPEGDLEFDIKRVDTDDAVSFTDTVSVNVGNPRTRT